MTSFSPFPRDALEQSIPVRFEAQVARCADRLAVRTGVRSWTYRELDHLANRVAHGITTRWGASAAPIGLLMPQGAELIAAILGILKAGRPYVPLDPAQPVSRSAAMLADAGVVAVVADRPVSGFPVPTVRFDDLRSAPPGPPPARSISADAVAYLYYTSGSTGRPKGVYDTHRNVLHNIMRYTNTLEIGPEDRLTLLQAPGFSGAVSSLFGALLNGASLFPYDVRKAGAGRPLARWITREAITIYHSVPALFRSFPQRGESYPSVRIIRLEGDAASRADLALFRAHFGPACRLVNGLGATETGLSRQFFVDQQTPLPAGSVPVGYPTPDMHAIILDPSGRDAGVGVVGEIAIRSRYLAAGYWGQPELTATRFLPGPPGSGERIYLTGDLGRLGPDGCLEYLGRKEADLRIRGHRVEPAEVEQALRKLVSVREAVVIGRPDFHGEPMLVAYVIPDDCSILSIAEVRRSLAQELPDYMIPRRFVTLDRFPLNENGKVDRKALAERQPLPVWSDAPSVAPRDALEAELVAICEGLLGVHPVGVTDNFFDQGGDSLTAASLLLEVERLAGRELPPTTILEAPTVERLAQVVRGQLLPARGSLVPVRTAESGTPFFCVPEHNGRVWSAYAGLARYLDRTCPFYGLQAPGLAGAEPPLTSIAAMASHFARTIREIQPHGPYWLGGRCFGAVVALEMAHTLIAEGESVELLFLIDVTPDDFPGLAPPGTVRSFRNYHRRENLKSWVETMLHEMRRRRVWKRVPYAVRALGRAARERGRVARVRRLLSRGRPVPERLRDVALLNRVAAGLHRSRPFPGRVTLVIRPGPPGLYAEDPRQTWGRLADAGYDVHYLPGSPLAFGQESQLRVVAEYLRDAISSVSAGLA